MRVAFDVSSLRGRKTGIGTYTENLMRALSTFTPEVEIVELRDNAKADQRTPLRILREQLVIPRLAKRARVDILHLTGFAAARRAPCPVVLNAHDLVGVLFARNFPPVARFYWSRYLPFSIRFATRLIVLSESTKIDVIRLGKIPPSLIQVIPPGCSDSFRLIEDTRALEEARAKLGLPEQFILFVSTLEPRKGVDTLIAAFARAASRISCDLVIVGRSGWYWESYLRQVKKNGLESRVRFLDYVQLEELPLIYNLARVFVFPSRYEGFGLTPLEAMACGAPVIASSASSIPEVMGEAGILIAPDDVEGFARAIVQVAGDPQLRKDMRARGLRQARKFSWERAARATAEVYKSILSEK